MARWGMILYGLGLYVGGFFLARIHHSGSTTAYDWDAKPRRDNWPDRFAVFMSTAGAILIAIGVIAEIVNLLGW